MRTSVLIGVMAAAGLSASALGQSWAEMDSGGFNIALGFGGTTFTNFDAGKRLSTANITDGIGALTQISGAFHFDTDVDLYQIRITDPGAFSVSTTRSPSGLALFDASGMGVAYNGDQAGAAATPMLTNALTGSLTPGLYYLAVVQGVQRPVNALGESIFNPAGAEDEVGPSALSGDNVLGTQAETDGMGSDAFGPWTNQTISTTFFSFPYTLTLTGASYAIPAPGALALAGLGGLVALRRRR